MRTLVNNLAGWELALLFIGGAVAIALAGFVIFERLGLRAAGTGADTMVAAFSNKATALFGVLLVFTIVSEFNHVNDAKSAVQTEATALAQIVRDADAFPPAADDSVRRAVAAYGAVVVHHEWRTLAKGGQPSPRAAGGIDQLQFTIEAYSPTGTVANEFYDQEAIQLNNLVAARRTRLQAAEPAIPSELLWLLVGGTIVFLATMLGFSASNDRLLVTMIVGLAALTGAGLLVAVLFDYPFSGSAGVSSAAYHGGVLRSLIPS